MADFQKDLQYLKDKGVSPNEVSKNTGLSKGSLYKVFDGSTEKPNRKTKETISEYAKKLREENNDADAFANAIDLSILDENDPYFIKKLAIVIRNKKQELLKEPIFRDFIYIEALKMVLKAKEGDNIDLEKLIELNNK